MEKNEPTVKLLAYSRGADTEASPDEIAAYAARSCFTEESAYEILKNKLDWSKKQIYSKNPEKYSSYEEVSEEKAEKYFKLGIDSVMKNSEGRGHTSVLDQSSFTFNITNLPRLTTLHLCLPHYLMHLQQSLRRANADRGFYLPEEIKQSELKDKTEEVLDEAFKLYSKMVEKGIPLEDARYILPLYTKTTITTSGNIRELVNLNLMTEQKEIPSITKKIVKNMIKLSQELAPFSFKEYEFEKEGKTFKGFNKEIRTFYPSQQLFSKTNEFISELVTEKAFPLKPIFFKKELSEEYIDKAISEKEPTYLSLLKHLHNMNNSLEGFLIPLSLAADHQLIRERTIEGATESIFSAVKRGTIVIPPSILNSELKEEYIEHNKKMIELYEELLEKRIGKSEAIGVIPHSIQIYNIVHVNGWNATSGFISKRYCIQAQWEIRAIASSIVKLFNKKNILISKYMVPRGEVWGVCPEFKPCPSREIEHKCPRAPEVNENIFHKLK